MLDEKLIEVMGDDVTQEQAFAHANDVLKNAVGGRVRRSGDVIHIPGHVSVDFEDVKTVMSEPGKAIMGTAVAAVPTPAWLSCLGGVPWQDCCRVRAMPRAGSARTAVNAIPYGAL
jgi:cell division protein FtsZ